RHRGVLRGRLRLAGHVQHPLHRAGRRLARRVPARGSERDAGCGTVRRQAGHQAGQESRSAARRGDTNLTVMNLTIHSSMLPPDAPQAPRACHRDTLGLEVRNDGEYGGLHRIAVGPPDQPGASMVLCPPQVTPGLTDDERRIVSEMMAKGTFASVNLATTDLTA